MRMTFFSVINDERQRDGTARGLIVQQAASEMDCSNLIFSEWNVGSGTQTSKIEYILYSTAFTYTVTQSRQTCKHVQTSFNHLNEESSWWNFLFSFTLFHVETRFDIAMKFRQKCISIASKKRRHQNAYPNLLVWLVKLVLYTLGWDWRCWIFWQS